MPKESYNLFPKENLYAENTGTLNRFKNIFSYKPCVK